MAEIQEMCLSEGMENDCPAGMVRCLVGMDLTGGASLDRSESGEGSACEDNGLAFRHPVRCTCKAKVQQSIIA